MVRALHTCLMGCSLIAIRATPQGNARQRPWFLYLARLLKQETGCKNIDEKNSILRNKKMTNPEFKTLDEYSLATALLRD